jgi:hypothetical protein
VRLRDLFRRLEQWRYLVLAAVLGAGLARTFKPLALSGDWWIFRFGAQGLTGTLPARQAVLLSSPLHFYVDMPKFQVGPPSLVAAVPFGLMPNAIGRLAAAVVMTAALLPLLYLLERTARGLGLEVARTQRAALLGGLLLTPAWLALSAQYMHLDDLIALALMVVAVHEISRDRGLTAALALGTSVASKPWAVGFLGLLLILPRAQQARAALVALATASAWWLPFVVAAPGTAGALGSVSTPVSPESVVALLTHQMPTWLRSVQLLAMIVVGAICARSRSPLLTPVAVIAVRIALDWQSWLYYGAGLVLAALVWDMLRGRRWPQLTAIALAATFVPSWAAQVSGPAAALTRLALLVALLVVGLTWEHHRPDAPEQPAAQPAPEGLVASR